jgi:hypothetical protein
MRENIDMRQSWNTLRALILLALLPCLLSFLLTFAANAVFGGLDAAVRVSRAFLTPIALTPLVTLVASLVAVVPLKRWGTLSERQHWQAGGCVALASLIGMAVMGAVIGRTLLLYMTLSLSVATGYIGFVWIGGAYLWTSLFPSRSESVAPTDRDSSG